MSHTIVRESRPYDYRYDPTYTVPNVGINNDPRVRAAASSDNMVTGTSRFKYFRRPIMPRMNPVPPNVLLAPVGIFFKFLRIVSAHFLKILVHVYVH
jgi:hypothetical protein